MNELGPFPSTCATSSSPLHLPTPQLNNSTIELQKGNSHIPNSAFFHTHTFDSNHPSVPSNPISTDKVASSLPPSISSSVLYHSRTPSLPPSNCSTRRLFALQNASSRLQRLRGLINHTLTTAASPISFSLTIRSFKNPHKLFPVSIIRTHDVGRPITRTHPSPGYLTDHYHSPRQ